MNRRKTWLKTGIGLLLTALMLFPIYWMINVSFTRDQDIRKTPPNWIPVPGTLEGYRAVLHQQGPYIATSVVVGFGTVALTLLLAAPAGYSLARLRPRGGGVLSFVLLIAQMIPGIIMAMGFYAIFLNLKVINTLPGLIVADSTLAVPFGVLIFTAFMSGIPEELLQASRIDGAGYLANLPLHRVARQPKLDRDRVTFRIPMGMVGLHLREHPGRRWKAPTHHPGHLSLHRQQQSAMERHHGHRGDRVDPGHRPPRRCTTLRRRRRHSRSSQRLGPGFP